MFAIFPTDFIPSFVYIALYVFFAGVLSTDTLTGYKELIETYTCEVLYLGKGEFKEACLVSPVPVTSWLSDVSLDKLIETLQRDNVAGAAGEMINNNIKEDEILYNIY